MNDHEEKSKSVTIIVNSREKEWSEKEIDYKQLVILAFGEYIESENVLYSISYSRGHDNQHEGTIIKGGSVKVKKGMVFNVTKTDKS